MPDQLQVRQGVTRDTHVFGDDNVKRISWGKWLNVPSPDFLIGHVIPDAGFVYEFRTAPIDPPNSTR